MGASKAWIAAAGSLAAAAGLAGWALWWEPRRARVHDVELRLPRWPGELDGLRVAVVADLHTGAPYVDPERLERIVRAVNRAHPDVVALLGDYVDPEVRGASGVAPGAVAARLAHLRAPCGVWAVLGNHDWVHTGGRMAAALRDAGLRVLENEAVAVTGAGTPFCVAGVADASEREPDVARALAGVESDRAVLLLSHDPDVFPRVPDRVALTISGHTHGGQADVPLLRGRVIPSRFGTRFKDGHVVEGGRHLFVSRGIGTSRLPLRFAASPEIPILVLRPG